MRATHFARSAAMTAAIALAGCAAIAPPARPFVPAALEAPAGETIYLVANGAGVQIYECALKAGQPPTYSWTLHSAEAALADSSGKSVGKHYYPGPTWESTDGSSFVSDVKARDPGSDKTAIPWLLLGTKSTAGKGLFTTTTSMQRIQTVGGLAPSATCNASNLRQMERVPYSAVFYFYQRAS
jgi:FtsP/CotA-like multicopper oxidase with cupredoxin domain